MKSPVVFFISLFILFQMHMVNAQEQLSIKTLEDAPGILGGSINANKIKFHYEGSPYLNDEFENGEIIYENKWQFTDIPLRYNVFYDVFEYKSSDQQRVHSMSPDTSLNMIIIPGGSFVVCSYEKDKSILPGYFKLLTKGRATLLAKLEVDFKQAQQATTHKVETAAKFTKDRDQYYVKSQNELPVKVTNAKKLIESLGDHQDDLTRYIKKEKISGKKEAELSQIVEYYNSL